MKRIAFVPFCSQQDKRHGKFLLGSDSGVKLCNAIAKRVDAYAELHLPDESQCYGGFVADVPVFRMPRMPIANNLRRLHWDTSYIRALAEYDAVFTTHDFLTIPLKFINPKVRVMAECGLTPDAAYPEQGELFKLVWKLADCVACNTNSLANMVKPYNANTPVWQFSYDETQQHMFAYERDVDIVINVRASATNYTNHELVLEALKGNPLQIRFTDPTRYISENCNVPSSWTMPPLNTYDHYALLAHSKVVINLATEKGGGTHSLREAMAHGCIPVVLPTADNMDMLGEHWPFYCERNVESVRDAIKMALLCDANARNHVRDIAQQFSHDGAWKIAKPHFERLLA
jgi:hypothetical protein